MSRIKTKEEMTQHKEHALQKMNHYLEELISSEDSKKNGKADKLSYWLEDWSTFLEFEDQFSPMSLRRYKRGEIIKVHLGFNIGSEEGGLHYAVVLDKSNAKSSPVVTIVPLTSVKPNTDLTRLKRGSIFLGNELFTNLNAKISATDRRLSDEQDLLEKIIDDMDENTSKEEYDRVRQRIEKVRDEINLLFRMKSEVRKMRIGSIALINQVTTVSKMRIYDPKTDHDILSGIRFSNEKLDLIDNEIRNLFVNS